MVIRRMVKDLDLAIEIVACPTVRERDGLAVSSRNAFLSLQWRRAAAEIYAALADAVLQVARGRRDAGGLTQGIESRIRRAGARSIDYVSVVHPETLEELEVIEGPGRICVAAHFGEARLIDNVAVDGSRSGG
jgi:pantoate--beta-alanine ligase